MDYYDLGTFRDIGVKIGENRGTPDIPLFIYKFIISNDLSPFSTGEPRPRRIFIPKYMRFFASKTHYQPFYRERIITIRQAEWMPGRFYWEGMR